MTVRSRFSRRLALAASFAVLAGCTPVNSPPRSVIFFTNQSVALDGPARGSIAEVVADANAHPNVRIHIRGFADPTVTPDVQALATKRAQVVTDELLAEGIAPARISQVGRAATRSEPGVESRRVEIEFR